MSKIGKLAITITNNITVSKDRQTITVSGPKGSLTEKILPGISIDINDQTVNIIRANDKDQSKAFHGLQRMLIYNMVHGVVNGWSKNLELVGTGYRANLQGKNLNLSIGYSHPVVIDAPEGISFKVDNQTKVSVEGINKQLVGQIAAKIRAVRPPEPYKAKGIRYENEVIRRKAGKTASGSN